MAVLNAVSLVPASAVASINNLPVPSGVPVAFALAVIKSFLVVVAVAKAVAAVVAAVVASFKAVYISAFSVVCSVTAASSLPITAFCALILVV